TYRTIEPRTLHLERQINPGAERALITTGVLGRMRHPRYVMFTMIALGNVLLTGYPLVVVSCGATMVLLWVTIRLEERELLEYFGEAFRDYRKSVPAFIPRPSRGGRDAVS
ncbi:MAG: methyltransferase family protein, partial [Candidatus Krumholzibacteriia bacterium]